MYWGGRMSDLVLDVTADMEAHPPPPHSLGAHMLGCKMPDTGARSPAAATALFGTAMLAVITTSNRQSGGGYCRLV
jgi:hypothetical protein